MKSKHILLPFVILLALAFTQCQKPSDILGKKKMTEITKDMLITEAYIEREYLPDSIARKYYANVLKQHHVSQAEYDSSLIWYSKNAHRLGEIYDRVQIELTDSKAVVDTFLSDSTYLHRLRYKPMESLWGADDRFVIPHQLKLWTYQKEIDFEGDEAASDTLVWSASLVGIAPDTFALRCRMILLNAESELYKKIEGIPENDATHLRYSFVLPDSIPMSSSAKILILLRKSQQTLFLQKIKLEKPKPIEITDETEVEEPNDLSSESGYSQDLE